QRNECYTEACTLERDRFGSGGSVMVWGGVSQHHRTELVVVACNLNAVCYREDILLPHVVPFLLRKLTEVLMAGKQYPSIQEFASAITNQLLLGSLLEHLCFVYERDPTRSHMLFKAIGQHLAAKNVLSLLAISEEFSTIRLQYNRGFTELLHAVSTSIFPQVTLDILTLREQEGLFQAQTSRYLSEFEELSILGKGSYGKVFKVKNKLDGQKYAVKKILIINVSREDCMKVLREVKVLSSLQHINVVGYHTAWMEHITHAFTSEFRSVFPLTCSSIEIQESTVSSSGSSKVFTSPDQSKEPVAIAKAPVSLPVKEEKSTQAVGPKTMRHARFPDDRFPNVLLGRCGQTRDGCTVVSWDSSALSEDDLGKTNDSPTKLCFVFCFSDPYGAVDTKQTLSILHKILQGVEYIHSRGIMHRDLKVFMALCSSSHTAGVGTFVYAAPEKLEGPHYDSNYRSGVPKFPKFQPFGTEMERVQTLGDLCEGKVPDSFSQRWPDLAKYITLLTSRDPTLRPSTTQLLQSELFSSKDMVWMTRLAGNETDCLKFY
uniref:Eukaryotic translation initiation factor 2-alpha kinase 1 n=1 Tax=Oncorhynchus tshawytscha TaxID=74940 RepID=A0A8C8C338_ONCTS